MGRAIALEFANEGASIVAADINANAVDAVAAEINDTVVVVSNFYNTLKRSALITGKIINTSGHTITSVKIVLKICPLP